VLGLSKYEEYGGHTAAGGTICTERGIICGRRLREVSSGQEEEGPAGERRVDGGGFCSVEVSRAANPLLVKGQLGSSDICTLAAQRLAVIITMVRTILSW